MKKTVMSLALISLFGLTACNQQPQGKIITIETAEIVPEPVKIDHYYSMKDGFEYGYEQAISADAQQAGQVASTLVMFKYSGEKDGAYQAYSKDGSDATTVLQCNNPCDYMKAMVFFNGEHIRTDRLKAVEGSIGWSVLADAINGKLEKYVGQQNGKKVNVWFTEQDGMQGTPIQP